MGITRRGCRGGESAEQKIKKLVAVLNNPKRDLTKEQIREITAKIAALEEKRQLNRNNLFSAKDNTDTQITNSSLQQHF